MARTLALTCCGRCPDGCGCQGASTHCVDETQCDYHMYGAVARQCTINYPCTLVPALGALCSTPLTPWAVAGSHMFSASWSISACGSSTGELVTSATGSNCGGDTTHYQEYYGTDTRCTPNSSCSGCACDKLDRYRSVASYAITDNTSGLWAWGMTFTRSCLTTPPYPLLSHLMWSCGYPLPVTWPLNACYADVSDGRQGAVITIRDDSLLTGCSFVGRATAKKFAEKITQIMAPQGITAVGSSVAYFGDLRLRDGANTTCAYLGCAYEFRVSGSTYNSVTLECRPRLVMRVVFADEYASGAHYTCTFTGRGPHCGYSCVTQCGNWDNPAACRCVGSTTYEQEMICGATFAASCGGSGTAIDDCSGYQSVIP